MDHQVCNFHSKSETIYIYDIKINHKKGRKSVTNFEKFGEFKVSVKTAWASKLNFLYTEEKNWRRSRRIRTKVAKLTKKEKELGCVRSKFSKSITNFSNSFDEGRNFATRII